MFSSATKYAIRAIVHLREHAHKGHKLRVQEIADAISVPGPYLSKVLQQLVRHGLVSSAKGRGGGFYLSEANLDKTLLDILICMEGRNVFDKCLLGFPECGEAHPCILHEQYKPFKATMNQLVRNVTLADLREK